MYMNAEKAKHIHELMVTRESLQVLCPQFSAPVFIPTRTFTVQYLVNNAEYPIDWFKLVLYKQEIVRASKALLPFC